MLYPFDFYDCYDSFETNPGVSPIDLPNCPYSQLAPLPAADDRPGHGRAASQGVRRPEGRSNTRLPAQHGRLWRLRQQQHWRRLQRRRRLLPLLHGSQVRGDPALVFNFFSPSVR